MASDAESDQDQPYPAKTTGLIESKVTAADRNKPEVKWKIIDYFLCFLQPSIIVTTESKRRGETFLYFVCLLDVLYNLSTDRNTVYNLLCT